VNQIERLQREWPEAAAFARGYLDYIRKMLDGLDPEAIAAFAQTLLDARESGAHIFFIGNGGSAATASHFANDVAIGCRSWDKPFRAMSLNDNVPVMTALANDYGYEEIFVRQLQTLMRPGDVVVAISASGNSPNIVKAIEYANANGAVTVGLTAFDGGALKRLSKVNVHVPTEKGEYGPAEDGHMILDHLIGAYLMHACRAAACK
jgi:D-sedoheptulose 7-phosphate isomerase